MQLYQWIESKPIGELTRLHLRTGIAYATIHKIYRGKKARYETAVRISACTGGAVSVAEICEPAAQKRPAEDLRRRPRLAQLEQKPKRKRKAKKGKRSAPAAGRRARAEGAAHAA
jgi:hypothetical protein